MELWEELRDLSKNLLWIWHPATIAIFRDIDPALWRKVNHNPYAFLHKLPPERLSERAEELAVQARVSYAFHRLHDYVSRKDSWGETYAGPLMARPVSYFSAEFGLHEALPIYSGGLGILAGDHIKTASDLGIPIVGVGLFYAQGYFNQYLDEAGWQRESYFEADSEHLPLERVEGEPGKPLRVYIETRSRRIAVGVWRAWIGRAQLLLLDSDVEENDEPTRELTGRLYGGDQNVRIAQELILGVGGVRAMTALGIRPSVFHLNEGHSAFVVLEMARLRMEEDHVSFDDAFRRVKLRTIFTTHTPVDAGHDRFSPDLIEEYLGLLRDELGLSSDGLMELGRVNPQDSHESFCMTVLGLKAAWKSNAVSAIHGHVTRRMWRGLWPGRLESEVPISHVTNGVHVASWVAPPMRQIYDRYLGPGWPARMCRPATWQPILGVDDGELWEAHQITKARLVGYVQRQVCDQEARRQGQAGTACDATHRRLDTSVLTLGFARRFATYKRADLLLADPDRLEKLVTHPDRPIQIIYAGKAHPNDNPGKLLIQRIFRMSRDSRFLGRVIFIEDYDINVARHLVQGVDVWLNAPRKPLEACGTSGMKALFNGTLNCSVLDGWWAEAYDGANGFHVGKGGQHTDSEEQNRRDAEALYRLLEEEVAPLYYTRNGSGIPVPWVERMKHAIRSLAWRFNADRMVMQYANECYLPMVGVNPTEDFGSCLGREF